MRFCMGMRNSSIQELAFLRVHQQQQLAVRVSVECCSACLGIGKSSDQECCVTADSRAMNGRLGFRGIQGFSCAVKYALDRQHLVSRPDANQRACYSCADAVRFGMHLERTIECPSF